MSKTIYNELGKAYSEDSEIKKRLDIMLMRRACLSLSVAKYADDKKVFKEDMKKVLSDKDLRRAISSIPFKVGIKKEKSRYLLFKFRLYFIIRAIFTSRYLREHK